MAVLGLGHFGYYVRDLEVMKDFWGNFMGMTLTKDRKSTRLNSSHSQQSRMPSSA